LAGSEKADSITSLTICSNKKFIAVAERSDHAQVFIYNTRTLRKFKNLHHDKLSCKEVVAMNFSQDNSLLITMGSPPDWTATIWNWNKAKILTQVQVSESSPVSHVSFSPVDAGIVCASGQNLFKFYRVTDNEMRPMPSSSLEGVNVISHIWLNQPDDHLVLGTDDGDLIIYNRSDLICHLDESPKKGKTKSLLSQNVDTGDGPASGNVIEEVSE